MTWSVNLSIRARDQLIVMDEYIAAAASPEIAARATDAIVDFCFSLAVFPERGTRRDDICHGLRVTNYRKRTVIAFMVGAHARQISIPGIFHGGQDHEAALASEDPPG